MTNRSDQAFVARLVTDEASARRVADVLTETLDASRGAVAAFAARDGAWHVEIYSAAPPELESLRGLVALAAGDAAADGIAVEKIAPRDWVQASLAGLKPVAAGRFVVHGAHDRARVPPARIGIEIEAALAFGTGHHGTTRGCLLALDALARRRRARHVLDVGTGSGVLAIAAARTFRAPVLATEIDLRSVQAARSNARVNRTGSAVRVVHTRALQGPAMTAAAPFDLVLANILMQPLRRMATRIARLLAPNARVVLSGLLPAHANAVLSTYRAQGLSLERRMLVDGWVTLVMARVSPRAS